MLKIRPAQLDAFRLAAVERFRRRALGAAAERGGGREPEQLAALVEEAMVRAPQYGITAEDDVIEYVLLLVTAGSGFEHELPGAAAILDDELCTGSRKIRRLRELIG
jgi:hypothetical protein